MDSLEIDLLKSQSQQQCIIFSQEKANSERIELISSRERQQVIDLFEQQIEQETEQRQSQNSIKYMQDQNDLLYMDKVIAQQQVKPSDCGEWCLQFPTTTMKRIVSSFNSQNQQQIDQQLLDSACAPCAFKRSSFVAEHDLLESVVVPVVLPDLQEEQHKAKDTESNSKGTNQLKKSGQLSEQNSVLRAARQKSQLIQSENAQPRQMIDQSVINVNLALPAIVQQVQKSPQQDYLKKSLVQINLDLAADNKIESQVLFGSQHQKNQRQIVSSKKISPTLSSTRRMIKKVFTLNEAIGNMLQNIEQATPKVKNKHEIQGKMASSPLIGRKHKTGEAIQMRNMYKVQHTSLSKLLQSRIKTNAKKMQDNLDFIISNKVKTPPKNKQTLWRHQPRQAHTKTQRKILFNQYQQRPLFTQRHYARKGTNMSHKAPPQTGSVKLENDKNAQIAEIYKPTLKQFIKGRVNLVRHMPNLNPGEIMSKMLEKRHKKSKVQSIREQFNIFKIKTKDEFLWRMTYLP